MFAAPRWLRDLGLASWFLLGAILLLVGLIWLLGATAEITQPVIAAFVVACVCLPLVRWLGKHHVGRAGAAAIVAVSALLAQSRVFEPLRYCGEHSIVIYLAFFLGMAASRSVLLKYGVVADVGTISAIVTLAGIVGALLLYWAVRRTPLKFLFERPDRFWIAPRKPLVLQQA